jgi:two-component system, chemotaxis family, protein-glutamate methylesterase/glutaminase
MTKVKSTRVLVVDDSRLFNTLMCDAIEAADGLELAGSAFDGQQALKLVEELHPDIVTLDVQMPKLDGIETLRRILASRPIPVVMVSSLTAREADITLQALDLGALDYLPKPDAGQAGLREFSQRLVQKIHGMAGADVRRILEYRRRRDAARTVKTEIDQQRPASTKLSPAGYYSTCIAIGISTGGPPALTKLLSELQPPLPPIVIVQHMPANFTGPFAKRLDMVSRLSVTEAEAGVPLEPNRVLLAPGGRHLKLAKKLQAPGSRILTRLVDDELVAGHRPSVDVLMCDVAQCYAKRSIGVIMTGMGHDGVEGCRTIRESGGHVIGQDASTSDIYGMNRVAFESGWVEQQYRLSELPQAINELAKNFA